MPSRVPAVQRAEGWSQDKQRSQRIFFDQHRCTRFPEGRPWWTNSAERPALQEGEVNTSALPMPVGELHPLDWDAPWFPPQSFFRYSSGLYEQIRVKIDYVSMKNQDTEATKAWYERAIREAAAQRMAIPAYGGVISWELEQIVGRAPRSPKIAEAAIAGDEWLLGLKAPVLNPRTGKYEVEENEALASLLRIGVDWLPTAAQAERRADELTDLRAELTELRAFMAEQRQAEADKKARGKAQAERMRNAKKGAKKDEPVGAHA